ncbi:hypothetical protein ACLIA0_13640 [Bacillaceae bacterium W0354]
MAGWSIANGLSFEDIAGHTIELILMWLIFAVLGIWVYYSAEAYYVKGIYKFIFVLSTILTGPIGLIIYFLFRNRCVR